MSVAVLVITDGREDYLAQTVRAAMAHLHGPVTEWWMYDDTGDPAHRARLRAQYPTFTHINAGPRQGFGGAIRASWAQLAARSRADHVFHLEQDFLLTRVVDLASIAAVLRERPYLVQMALRRQPWSPAEIRAGGVVEMDPNGYIDMTDSAGRSWLEHGRFFTTNPSLYRRSLLTVGWPEGSESEGRFGLRLLERGSPEASAVRFAYWGDRFSGVWAEHIGHQRAGSGY